MFSTFNSCLHEVDGTDRAPTCTERLAHPPPRTCFGLATPVYSRKGGGGEKVSVEFRRQLQLKYMVAITFHNNMICAQCTCGMRVKH